MTEQEQNIAIAKWMGDKLGPRMPNFTRDLNAIHEAEEKITDHTGYVINLKLVTKEYGAPFFLIHATAAQRAESLLRTLNLWTE